MPFTDALVLTVLCDYLPNQLLHVLIHVADALIDNCLQVFDLLVDFALLLLTIELADVDCHVLIPVDPRFKEYLVLPVAHVR